MLVQDRIADFKKTTFWYVPRFEFSLGTSPAVVEVRVWAWLQIKSIKLIVDGEEIYAEQPHNQKATDLDGSSFQFSLNH